MDAQQERTVNKTQQPMKYMDITGAINGCAFDVLNELGVGFLESVYEKALVIALRQKGFSVKTQQPIAVMFRGQCVGEFFADILVEEKVIVELKTVTMLLPKHAAQVINYLKATGIEVGVLLNFGNPKLEHRRFDRYKDYQR
jgi:GxxExxY protein